MVTQLKDNLTPFVQFIIDKIDIPIFFKDTNGNFLMVNKILKYLLGLSEIDIVNKKVDEFINDKEYIQKVNETEKDFFGSSKDRIVTNLELNYLNHTAMVELVRQKIYSYDKKVIGIFGMIYPTITDETVDMQTYKQNFNKY